MKKQDMNYLAMLACLIVFLGFAGCRGGTGGGGGGGGGRPFVLETSITSYPATVTNVMDASFQFSCNKSSCGFECDLDGLGWEACSSPITYAALAEGGHAFKVRAIFQGAADPTPASHAWTIKTTPPVTTITFGPPDPTNLTLVTIGFECANGPCNFECKLDDLDWAPCTPPITYNHLENGAHIFQVRATDLAGNVELAPKIYSWTVNTVPSATSIDSWPPDPCYTGDASFTFHCSNPPCTFECNLDYGGWVPCTSPKDYTGLSYGTHIFQVRSIDQAGNVDHNPPGYVWTITTPPVPVHNVWIPDTILNNMPDPRYSHSAVWTGSEMIIWGGAVAPWGLSSFNTGARYIPAADAWIPTSTGPNCPSPRYLHTAVWTGTDMIIWGGAYSESWFFTTPLNDGGIYNPTTDSWSAISIGANVPDPRYAHIAVWTGSEMIVWGGYQDWSVPPLNTGGRYRPATNTWTAVSTGVDCPSPRYQHSAVWTGTQMIVWGGYDDFTFFNDGGRYSPAADSWTTTSLGPGVPDARYIHTAVWTGTEMIVWGGYGAGYLNSGGKYNPVSDTWTPTSTGANLPSPRYGHSAVWAGNKMIVWGGSDDVSFFNSGGRYNPTSDSWLSTNAGADAPMGRYSHTAVWTGAQMIIFGGSHGPSLNTWGRYDPGADSWAKPSLLSARYWHSAVWTGAEMIVWGGADSNSQFNTGARYNPSTDSWSPTSTGANCPSPRSEHSAVWTGTHMIIWAGFDGSSFLNSGGKYAPATDSWSLTSTGANVPAPRDLASAIWTGSEMIVWGGFNGFPMGTGGRYLPFSNIWTATSTGANVPAGRCYHSAIWTGSQMIIWGGYSPANENTGAKYSPSSDFWTPTSVGANCPAPRFSHTAIWTGTQMIVWGGYDGVSAFNTGARYNPFADAWLPTSIAAGAFSPRYQHSAVWTGAEMVVWGGFDGSSIFFGTGGKYNPSTDSWSPTSIFNIPGARSQHTAIWTGAEMIVWGGWNGMVWMNSGGIYLP